MNTNTCTHLAEQLDIEMLEKKGVYIYTPLTRDQDMPWRSGQDVARELGGRLLVRYLPKAAVKSETGISPVQTASTATTFVTPTAYAPSETIHALGLPFPSNPRTHALLLDPERIPEIQGPRRTRKGTGLEYILPNGYPGEALSQPPWAIEVK